MVYREIEEKDVLDIAKLYVDSFNAHPWNDEWTIESASNRILQMINCEGFYGLTYYDEDDKLIGMILGNHEYYYNGMHFNIKEFCVDINIRGKGIGSEIIEEFINRLKNRGINEIILFTSRTDGTEGFYNKRGFESFNSMVMMGKEI